MALSTPQLQPRSRNPRDWGNYPAAPLLPNAAGAPLPLAQFALEAGDTAHLVVGPVSIAAECQSPGTPGGADAVWLPTAATAPPALHAPTHRPVTGSDPLATAAPGTISVGDAAATGVGDSFARNDHQHALPAPAAPVDVTKAAAAAGVATSPARADHKHDVTTAVPATIGAANAEGVAVSLARSDHVHDHGALAGGALHALATALLAGFMSAANFTKLAGYPASPPSAVLWWGNDNVTNTTTTRFLSPGFSDTLAQTTTIQWRVPRAGTLRFMRVRHNVVGASANLVVYTLRVNGVATALLVSMAASASDGSNLVATVAVVAGDLVDIQVTKAVALVGATPTDIVADMEFN